MGHLEPHSGPKSATCTLMGKVASLLLDRSQGSSPIPQKVRPGFPKKQVSADRSPGGAVLRGISHSCQLPTPPPQGAAGSVRK